MYGGLRVAICQLGNYYCPLHIVIKGGIASGLYTFVELKPAILRAENQNPNPNPNRTVLHGIHSNE